MRINTAHLRILAASLALVAALACAGGLTVGVVYTDRRPPPDRVEVVVASPGPGYVWAPGYWRWEHNDYHWRPGHWKHAKHGYHRWMPGHWEHQAHQWYWVEGRWAR